MIKKLLFIILLAMAAVSLVGCGGSSGDSTSSTPVGVNPGVASRVELMATANVNQTNSYCFFKAKVIDGNGVPMKNHEVIFTNLSLTGVLDHTTAVTGANGIATVTLYSTVVGFATVQAEVNTGSEKIRDRKTVYFSAFDMTAPAGLFGAPTLTLATSNAVLFEGSGDNTAVITATVRNASGNPVVNSLVTFGTDSVEATFPLSVTPTTAEVHTGTNGEASTLVSVDPIILRSFDTVLNITASADNGTFNVISLFLKPVTISSVAVTAAPSTIASAATSTITAVVTTSAGTPVPDGTSVNFSTTGTGSITPFSQTTNGIATATYTAPTVTTNTTASVRASVGTATGTATVTITAPVVPVAAIVMAPTSGTVSSAAGATLTFAITGGLGPFTVTSSSLTSACRDADSDNLCTTSPPDFATWSVLAASPTFVVRVPIGAPSPSTAILSISDSSVPAKTATVVITIGP